MDYRDRARNKLQDIHTGRSNDQQVGPTPLEIFAGMMLAAVLAVPMLAAGLLSFAGWGGLDLVSGTMLMVMGLIIGFAILKLSFRNPLTTPEAALRAFMSRVATCDYHAAYRLVVNGDKDDTPRTLGNAAYSFEHSQGFQDYWDAMQDSIHPSVHTGHIMLADDAVRYLGRDVALVVFSLPAVNGRPGHSSRKLLVKIDDEWRIFNGALGDDEERDVSWAEQPRMQHSTAALPLVAA